MSIRQAQLFLSKVQHDKKFRNEVISTNSEQDLFEVLSQYNISFSSSEIENAFNMLHVACQSEEDAEDLKHAYLYYQLLVSLYTQ